MEASSTKDNPNIFAKLNPAFAYFFACLPVITMLFALAIPSEAVTIEVFYMIWMFIYAIMFISFAISNFGWLKQASTKDKIVLSIICIAIIMFFWIILSAIITQTFALETLFMLSYALLFACIMLLNKKQIKIFLHILLASICFCFLINIADPSGKVIEFFAQENIAHYSSVFVHANYSSTIASMLIMVAINLAIFCKKKWLTVLYAIYFVVFSVFIYLNASFAGITAVYFMLVVEFVVLWIKNKKCPWQILAFFASFVGISLLLELIPNVHQYSTSKYNYFVEVTAVFDNIFHTHLLQEIFHIEVVPGSDGWNRSGLLKHAIYVACGGEKTGFFAKLFTILFGVGAGSVSELRPHNFFVGLWLEYGLIFALLFIALIVFAFIYIIKKTKGKTNNSLPFMFAIGCYLFCTLFGSIKACHFIYLIVMIAIATKFANIATKENSVENN